MSRAPLFLLLLWTSTVSWAQTSTLSERLQILRMPEGELRLRVNAGEPLALSEDPRGSVERDGVRMEKAAGGIAITASRRPISFEVGELSGELPAEGRMKVTWEGDRSIEIESGESNGSAMQIRFADGAKAELPGAASCRGEFFDEGAYTVYASTNVIATTGDGLAVRFSRHTPLMLGGPLKDQVDARGTPRKLRATPAGRIDLAGSVEGEVRLASHGVTLMAGQERMISFPNGARVLLRQDAGKAALQWKVLRGVCHFSVAGFSCWKATASSGQSGTLEWNTGKRVIDLKHDADSSGGWVIAQLSGRVSTSVSRGATFQYAQFQDCGSFATSAIGDVELYDRESGESVAVEQGAVSYNEGRRIGGGTAYGRPFGPISLLWDNDTRIRVRGSATSYPIANGTEQTLSFGGDNLAVAYRTDGSILLRALEGNFNVTVTLLPEISIDVPEGGAMILRLNRQRLMFTAESARESAADLRVISGGKTYTYLSGTSRVSVVLGQNSILPEGAASWIFFEGAGGNQDFLSGRQEPRILTPSRIDVSRIPEQPVSVIE